MVECGLKACIAGKTRQGDFPSRERAQQSYRHRAVDLRSAAELTTEWIAARDTDPQLGIHWTVVSEWTEESRYRSWTEREARNLLQAIVDPDHGVFEWIRQHW